MEFGKAINQKITIEASGNKGFLVKVGCGQFVYTDKGQLIADLTEYLYNPEDLEAEYNEVAKCLRNPESVPDRMSPETATQAALRA